MRRPTPPSLFSRAAASIPVLVLLLFAQRHGQAADPQPYVVAFAPTGNAALDTALKDSSTLVSLRESAPVGAFALIGRARQDQTRFATALSSFGYYKGAATVTIAGHPLDDPALPDLLDRAPADPPVQIKVAAELGPLFHLGRVTVDGTVPAEARSMLGLAPGAPAVAADVVAARDRLLNAMRDEGYALATVSEPAAFLEPDADKLDVTFKASSGPRVDLGPITVAGLQDVNESFVRRRLLVHEGEQFNPEALDKARQDLIGTGVFSSVVVTPATQLDPAGELPVTFKVMERPKHAVSFGAAYSTDLGVYATATWTDRNLFGNAEQLNITAGFTGGGSAQPRPGYNLSGQFIKPDFLARDQSLQVDLGAVKQSFDAYDQTALLGDVLLNRKLSEHWSGSAGVAGEIEKITQEGVDRNYTLVGIPVSAKYDSSNNLFEPTEGIRGILSVTPTESLGNTNATFVILQASGSTYIDMPWLGGEPGRSVLAFRGLVGDAEGASQFELPPDKRFYAGGSATVRGYKYQSVGPRFPDNKPQGGTSVAAGTVEFRQRILESFGMALFADVGQVAASGAPFSGNWAVGVGTGARYYTPIGPIRVDVAFPLNKQPGGDSFEFYIGIGQAF
ncbi:MAG: outer membrane protein assembly factor [Acetobacteraceae bacterium]|nr:outer membrane protein assembly factor [Acetobacteraceae bacterium]